MDPKLSNPNNQINQPVSDQPQNPTAPQSPAEPVIPVVNPVVQQNPIEPVPVSQAPPQYPIQQPTTLPPVQSLPIQNTLPPTMPQTSQSEPVAPPPDTNFDGLPKKHLISKKVAAIAVVLFLTVSIPLTVFVTNQQQNTKTGAVQSITEATIVGKFNGQDIKASDLKDVILEQYSSDSILNPDVIRTARDLYVERKILDLKTQDAGVTDEEINALADSIGLSTNEAKYELLRQKIILGYVKYVKAVSIGYWVPPDDAGQNYTNADQAIVTGQDQEGASAIIQATSALNNGQDVLTIAKSISANSSNSNLASVLSMNGSKFAQIPDADKQTAAEPVLYEYGDTNFDDKTKNILFGAEKDAVVSSGEDQSNGGQVVFKIIDKGNGTYDSYKVWLEQQKGSIYIPVNF